MLTCEYCNLVLFGARHVSPKYLLHPQQLALKHRLLLLCSHLELLTPFILGRQVF